MTQQQVEEVPTPEPVETAEAAKPDYDLHIKVPAEMRSILRDSAELAFKLGYCHRQESTKSYLARQVGHQVPNF